jgi:DNA-binding transcriptional MocR family regulator
MLLPLEDLRVNRQMDGTTILQRNELHEKNDGRLPQPTDGCGQTPAVELKDTHGHTPYMARQNVAGLRWASNVHSMSGPIYLSVVNALETSLSLGHLTAGQRLPSQRALAKYLSVDLTTITRAFDEARKRGLIETRGPQGSFVAPPKADFTQRVDLSMNAPPIPDTDEFTDVLRRSAATVLARSDALNLMTYHVAGGNATDRHAAASWLQPMLGQVDGERLVITEGAQVAISATIVSLAEQGAQVLCDKQVYPGLLHACSALSRGLIPVEGDEHGMCPEALVRQARHSGARLVYLNPTFQNPTAITMPIQRRMQIANALKDEGLIALEDDPYWHFHDESPTPIAAMASGNVFYISTLSKAISPGLRTAFVQCPTAPHARSVSETLRGTRQMGHPLISALASQVLLDGSASSLLSNIKTEACERVRMANYLLPPKYLIRAGGIHAWCSVPAHWTDISLAHAAKRHGVTVAPSSTFSPPPNLYSGAIRLSLGLASDRQQLRSALTRIDRLLMSEKDDMNIA